MSRQQRDFTFQRKGMDYAQKCATDIECSCKILESGIIRKWDCPVNTGSGETFVSAGHKATGSGSATPAGYLPTLQRAANTGTRVTWNKQGHVCKVSIDFMINTVDPEMLMLYV
jgi:hypothetical protein